MDLVRQAQDFIEKANASPDSPATYILQLSSGAYYVGATINLLRRMWDHADRTGGKTTRDTNPEALLFVEFHTSFTNARRREAQIKRWSRAKKEAHAIGDQEALSRLSHSRD
jgi:putative endonuclease